MKKDVLTILVVDDEAPLREMYSMFIAGLGHVVATAASGDIAFGMCKTYDYDAVLADLNMFGINGIELSRLLAEKDGRRPTFILMSTDEVSPEKAGEHVDHILRKPFSRAVLGEKLQEL